MIRRICFLVVFVLLLALVSCVGVADAQGSVPYNPSYDASVDGWMPVWNGAWSSLTLSLVDDTTDGHTANGCVKAGTGAGYAVSRPFNISGASSVSVWQRGFGGFMVLSLTSGGGLSSGNSSPSSWTQVILNTSSLSGIVVIVAYVDSSTGTKWDDWSVTGGSSYYLTSYYNGAAESDISLWLGRFGDSGVWDGFNGYPAGSFKDTASTGDAQEVVSPQIYVQYGGFYNFWLRSTTTANVNVCVTDSETNSVSCWSPFPMTTTWSGYSADLTPFSGHTVAFLFWTGNINGASVWIDQICPASGCVVAPPADTPTPGPSLTPTPTAAYFPYGYGTPVPVTVPTIDWSQYPTLPPYPTFPIYPTQAAYPTQAPYPTQVYGEGTAQPVVINGGSPIPVYLTTPMPTQLPYPTAMYGLNTPQPILVVQTPTPTVVFATSAALAYSDPVDSSNQLNYGDPLSNAPLVLGADPSSENHVIDVHLKMSDFTFNIGPLCSWPGAPIHLPTDVLCTSILVHYQWFDRLMLGGYDFMWPFNALSVLFLETWVLIRIRKR